MSLGDQSDDVLSVEQVSAAIDALSVADWSRIQRAALFFAGSADAAGDLRQEALYRALSGQRRCPKHIGVVRFVNQIMRSIVSAKRKPTAEKTLKLVVVDGQGAADTPVETDPGPEAKLIGERATEHIRSSILALFQDDEVAQTVADGIMEELEGGDLCELAGISKQALATKRKLILRRVQRAFPNGWHHDR